MTDLEIIKGARELIADPERWAQGWYAYDRFERFTNPSSYDACRWCAMGAIRKMAPDLSNPDAESPDAVRIYRLVHPRDLGGFNDRHKHAEVLQLFDDAIAELEGGE